MFSSNFVISATFNEETDTTSSTIDPYKERPTSKQSFVWPPTILGVVFVLNLLLPGSLSQESKQEKFFANIHAGLS